jgi:hypothetical protein
VEKTLREQTLTQIRAIARLEHEVRAQKERADDTARRLEAVLEERATLLQQVAEIEVLRTSADTAAAEAATLEEELTQARAVERALAEEVLRLRTVIDELKKSGP